MLSIISLTVLYLYVELGGEIRIVVKVTNMKGTYAIGVVFFKHIWLTFLPCSNSNLQIHFLFLNYRDKKVHGEGC